MRQPVAASLIIENGKLLLVHNVKYGLNIEPPGGKQEENETLEETTIRETLEEVGVEVSVGELLAGFDVESPEGQFTVYNYFCNIVSGEPKVVEPDKIPKFNWYSYDELEKLSKEGVLSQNMTKALPLLKDYLK